MRLCGRHNLCAPRLLDCRAATLAPIAGTRGADALQDRWANVSPDGRRLVWTRFAGGRFRMLLAALARDADGTAYRVDDVRDVTPPGDAPAGTAARFAADTGAWYEAKGFADGGRTLMFSATRDASMNLDDYALDLATGAVRRLTTNTGWDEDPEASPDGRWVVTGGGRAPDVMAPFDLVPVPALFDPAKLLGVHRYSQSGEARRGEFRSPVILPRAGESPSHPGIVLTAGAADGWYVAGAPMFSSDGRLLVWSEFRSGRPGHRVRLADVTALNPGRPVPAVATPLPAWAPVGAGAPDVSAGTAGSAGAGSSAPERAALARAAFGAGPAVRTLAGRVAGTLTLERGGGLGARRFTARYRGYADTPGLVIDGEESATVSLAGSALVSHLRVRGAHTGRTDIDVTFHGTRATGRAASTVDGRTATQTFDDTP